MFNKKGFLKMFLALACAAPVFAADNETVLSFNVFNKPKRHALSVYAEAMNYYGHSILLEPVNGQLYYLRALAEYNLSEYESALKDFNMSVYLDDRNAAAYNGRAVVRAVTGDYKGALEDLTRAMEFKVSYLDILCFNRGYVYFMIKDYGSALYDINTAVSLNPSLAQAYYVRAAINEAMKNYENACEDYNELLRRNPEFSAARLNRGKILAELGYYYSAVKDFDDLIDADEQNAHAYYYRGGIKYYLSDYLGAINDYTRVINISTSLAKSAYFERARAKERIGDRAGSMRDYDDSNIKK